MMIDPKFLPHSDGEVPAPRAGEGVMGSLSSPSEGGGN